MENLARDAGMKNLSHPRTQFAESMRGGDDEERAEGARGQPARAWGRAGRAQMVCGGEPARPRLACEVDAGLCETTGRCRGETTRPLAAQQSGDNAPPPRSGCGSVL